MKYFVSRYTVLLPATMRKIAQRPSLWGEMAMPLLPQYLLRNKEIQLPSSKCEDNVIQFDKKIVLKNVILLKYKAKRYSVDKPN